MSKVQGKDSDLLNNLTDTGIASELDSRLRDLEKNIAVAREFIKLADESYSELRHKWNLIQEEARNKSATQRDETSIAPSKKKASQSSKKEAQEMEEKESKTEELGFKDFEEFTKSEPSRSPSKHGKSRKESKGSDESVSSSSQIESVNPSKGRAGKQKKDRTSSRKV